MVITANICSSPHSNVLQPSPPRPVDHQVVDLILVSAVGGTLGKFVDVWVWKESPANDKVVCSAAFQQSLSIVVHACTSFHNHGSLVVGVITSNFGIQVAHHYLHFMSWCVLQFSLLALFLTVVGWCVALDDGGIDVLPSQSDLHQPAVNRLGGIAWSKTCRAELRKSFDFNSNCPKFCCL